MNFGRLLIECWMNCGMNFGWTLGETLVNFLPGRWYELPVNCLDRHFLEFSNLGDCCILHQQMAQFHGWFWRVGKIKKIWAKLRVRKIHPEFIQNSLQNSFRNSPKIHPRIYSEIHDDNLKIHLEFTARDSSRDNGRPSGRHAGLGRPRQHTNLAGSGLLLSGNLNIWVGTIQNYPSKTLTKPKFTGNTGKIRSFF